MSSKHCHYLSRTSVLSTDSVSWVHWPFRDQTGDSHEHTGHPRVEQADKHLLALQTAYESIVWPPTYSIQAPIRMVFIPVIGIVAFYSSLMSRAAINEGHFIVAMERSRNTRILVAYSYMVFTITLITFLIAYFMLYYYKCHQ